MIALVDTSSCPCSAGKTGNCQRTAVPACRWPQRLPHSQYSGFGANLSKCIRGSDRESAYLELLRARRCSSVMCVWPGNQSGAGMKKLEFSSVSWSGQAGDLLALLLFLADAHRLQAPASSRRAGGEPEHISVCAGCLHIAEGRTPFPGSQNSVQSFKSLAPVAPKTSVYAALALICVRPGSGAAPGQPASLPIRSPDLCVATALRPCCCHPCLPTAPPTPTVIRHILVVLRRLSLF